MASEKLVKAIITGPSGRAEEAIRSLVLGRQFHVLNAANALRALGPMEALEEADPYRVSLDAASALLEKLGIERGFMDFADKGCGPEDSSKYISDLAGAVARLTTHKTSEESLVAENVETKLRLAPFAELGVDIGELLAVRHLTLRFGVVTAESYEAVKAAADESEDIYFFRTGTVDEKIYCAYLALPESADKAAEELSALGFAAEDAPDPQGLTGIPTERLAAIDKETAEAREKAEAAAKELEALRERERTELLMRYSYLRFMSAGAEKRGLLAEKDGRFYLTGWLPEKGMEDFLADVKALGFEAHHEKPGLGELKKVPVKFTDGFLSRIFSPFVEMYGYPGYGETDPRLFMTITYCLLFGIMFGDVGQGAVLFLLGLLFAKKGMWLGRIIAAVGCSAVVFGFVYGSVFGNEHLLPGFKVLEDGNLTTILLVGAGVGVLLIAACGVLNIMTGFRQHDYKKAIFSANGICGVVFFVSLVVGAACTLLFGVNLLGNPLYTVPLILLPVLLIWVGEPIVWRMEGKHGKAPSMGMVILEGFFDLFESCLSWFSNLLSFLRVGTYTICHAIMMLVVFTLSANGEGGYSIFGLVLGNIFVMFIEAVLVCIQVLRLEFYELFGRFYTGQGSPFEVNTVDYSNPGARAA